MTWHLTVLATVARDSELWPGTRFAVGGAAADFAASANRMGVTQNVVIYPDYRGAEMDLTRLPVPPRRHLSMTPDRFAPGLAREAVQEFCADLRVRTGADAAQLVASELVTNAVVHAGTSIDMTLRLVLPHLHIAVRDQADGAVHITDDDPESRPYWSRPEVGRGLGGEMGKFPPSVRQDCLGYGTYSRDFVVHENRY